LWISKKTFDTVDRETLWRILRHHSIPDKLISITVCQYRNSKCRVIQGGWLTEAIEVKTGRIWKHLQHWWGYELTKTIQKL